MTQTQIIAIAVVLALIALVAILLVARATRRQSLVREARPAELRPTMQRTMERVTPTVPEGQGIASEAAAGVADVIGQILGIDAHHDAAATVATPGDRLTALKGLGPKAAATLHGLGVTTYAQIAAWNDGDVAAIDAQLGAFKGRIERDQWVEQARLLAADDIAGFEGKFGKLG